MEIKVTGCHDCKTFAIYDRFNDTHYCRHPYAVYPFNLDYEIDKKILCSACPLKQETITIKLKENDTTGVCKEGE